MSTTRGKGTLSRRSFLGFAAASGTMLAAGSAVGSSGAARACRARAGRDPLSVVSAAGRRHRRPAERLCSHGGPGRGRPGWWRARLEGHRPTSGLRDRRYPHPVCRVPRRVRAALPQTRTRRQRDDAELRGDLTRAGRMTRRPRQPRGSPPPDRAAARPRSRRLHLVGPRRSLVRGVG
jgi:hypothetical protein